MFCNHDIYGTVERNSEEISPDNSIDGLDTKYIRSNNAFCTYATLQEVLLRASTSSKVEFLSNLFKEIGKHKYMKVMFKILHTYFIGKLSKYYISLDQSTYVNDINMKDNDRLMETKELNQCFEEVILWFRYLEDTDLKMGIFLSLLAICGKQAVYRILQNMKTYFNTRPTRAKLLSIPISCPPEDLSDDYVEIFDETDPDAQLIIKKRTEWQESIAKYRSKVEDSLSLANNIPRRKSSTSQKGKRISKSSLKMPADIDYIQLMPVWIVLQIFSYLDAKSLKEIKKVNPYWEFVSIFATEEEKSRKLFNKWIDSIKAEHLLTDVCTGLHPENVKPYNRFSTPANPLACDMKIYKTLKAHNTLQPLKMSLLSEVANNEAFVFHPPVVNLEPFTRNVMLHVDANARDYLHKRPPCTHIDKKKIDLVPIKDIPLVGDSLPHLPTETIKSFEFVPSTEEFDVISSEKSMHVQFPTYNPVGWNSVRKNLEFDQTLSSLMAKSIAHYVAKVTSSVLSRGSKDAVLSLEPSLYSKSFLQAERNKKDTSK